MENCRTIKIEHAVGRDYEYKILSTERKDLSQLRNVRMNVSCAVCGMEGQYWWQVPVELRLEFYCPSCNVTWSIFCIDTRFKKEEES